MSEEDKAALYNILYAKFMQFSVEIEAIKAVLTKEQQAQLNAKINELTNQTHNSGALDLILDYLRPTHLDLP